MTPIKHLDRRLARVPTWAAVLLLSTPIGAALSYTFAAHDVAVESSATAQAKASALTEAKAEAAAAKRALARKEAALAAANAKLREVGEKPVKPDADESEPPVTTAPAMSMNPFLLHRLGLIQ